MPEIIDIEKTRPIVVLEGRRDALIGWLADGRRAIIEAEDAIRTNQEQAIEMVAEIDEIETALNALYAVQNKETMDAETG